VIKHVLLSPNGETVLAVGVDTLTAYATQTGAPLWTQPFNADFRGAKLAHKLPAEDSAFLRENRPATFALVG
jgi:hypothetical protein